MYTHMQDTHALSKEKIIFIAGITALALAVGSAGTLVASHLPSSPLGFLERLLQSGPQDEITSSTTIKVVSEESAVIDAVKKAAPAVVSIVATADVPKLERCYTNPFGNSGLGLQFRIPSTCQNGTEEQQVSAGTGYLVTDDGYLMTNKHVVSGAAGTKYTVILNDEGHKGQEVEATVLATDPTNDIAVLKIDLTGLPYLTFADSDAVQVGQTAIAIGYALGEFQNTVSKGVVSGLSRQIDAGGSGLGTEHLYGIIQTDAALNPGNSGGPLLDISGNVIGMNVAVASAEGIAFSIPANDVQSVFESVKNTGKIERAFLGVRYVPIDADLKEQQGLAYDYGALVVRGDAVTDLAVTPGSPADKAGIVENDILLEWNGQRIDDEHGISELVAQAKVGDVVTLKISHKGEEKTAEVTLAARPTE
jgi:serine protease Do